MPVLVPKMRETRKIGCDTGAKEGGGHTQCIGCQRIYAERELGK